MEIFVDADACPVIGIVEDVAKEYGLSVTLLCDTNHILHSAYSLSLIHISPEEYFDIVPYVMYNMEQPLGDASAIAFALACRATAKHTKLCYSGEGADEFFGGYNTVSYTHLFIILEKDIL